MYVQSHIFDNWYESAIIWWNSLSKAKGATLNFAKLGWKKYIPILLWHISQLERWNFMCIVLFGNFQYIHKILVNYITILLVRIKAVSLQYSATLVVSKPLFGYLAMKEFERVVILEEQCVHLRA